jgi:cellulose synthase/poly-beta-1,6-N-acetylglucosamine synthase-like glycosyltransferase
MLMTGCKKLSKRKTTLSSQIFEPEVSVLIAAYNEKDIIHEKVNNLLSLDYPKDKIQFIWITDGSDDGTPEILSKYPEMKVLHQPERKGKIGAINRAMKYVQTPFVVFCDANNTLSINAIRNIIAPFANDNTGCVAGEKQIVLEKSEKAASSGEGIYWRYESLIKRLESDLNSTIGAAGELFAIRTSLFQEVEPDTILDDFVISLRIAQQGFSIKYAPNAIAIETGSENIAEEMKRKIRIAAGSFQTIVRMHKLLNIFKFGMLSFQYWSHKILRWAAVPFSLIFVFFLNVCLVVATDSNIYLIMIMLQSLFYVLALWGYANREKKVKFRFLFMPYYLVVMNVAEILGLLKYLKGQQSVNWEKARRG